MDTNQTLEVQLTLDILTLKKNIESVQKHNKPDYLIAVFQALINHKEDELRLHSVLSIFKTVSDRTTIKV